MGSNVLQEIERLKNEKPTWERRMRWDGMKAVFGGSPSLLWCNPFTGLRLRRLMLLTHGRRGGSEFSVWEDCRLMQLTDTSPCLVWWKKRISSMPSSTGATMNLRRRLSWVGDKTFCSNGTQVYHNHYWESVLSITCWCGSNTCDIALHKSDEQLDFFFAGWAKWGAMWFVLFGNACST